MSPLAEMVTTRGKKRTSSPTGSFGEEEAAENASTEMHSSDSPRAKAVEPKVDAQVEDKVEVPVEEARNEQYEETSGEEDSEKMKKIENGDANATMTKEIGDHAAESEQNTSEDDEMDDQDVMWEDDYDSEDSEENVDEDEDSEEEEIEEQDEDEDEDEDEGEDEDEVGKEGIGEEHDDEDFGVSEEEAIEEEGNQEKTQEEKKTIKLDGRGTEEQKTKKTNSSLKNSEKSSKRSTKKEQAQRQKKVSSGDKPESSSKGKATKRVQTMGMIFMCSSKTKDDCYKYKVLGLPESKKDLVKKIYSGMRLFLYDVDLKLLYGIYKAKGPGGYNIEPKAFKSQFPSQVRFAILKDCLPVAEEKFKKVIKDNYFTKTKFNCVLKSEQVKKLCKLFIASNRGHKPTKLSRSHKAEDHHPVRGGKSPRRRGGGKRRVVSREDRERPRKRPREVIRPMVPARRPLPASVSARRPLPASVSARTPYLESRSPNRNRRTGHRNPYRDGRYPPTEYDDYYRDGREYLGRGYRYRDGLDEVVRSDPYSEYRDPYPESRGQGLYLEPRDLYRNERDPYTRGHDSYRDGHDSALYRRDLYRDRAYPEPYGSTFKRGDPLSDRHEVYRRDELLERRDVPTSSLESRRRIDIGSQDSYAVYEARPSYAEPIYSSEYPPRAGVARQYRL